MEDTSSQDTVEISEDPEHQDQNYDATNWFDYNEMTEIINSWMQVNGEFIINKWLANNQASKSRITRSNAQGNLRDTAHWKYNPGSFEK